MHEQSLTQRRAAVEDVGMNIDEDRRAGRKEVCRRHRLSDASKFEIADPLFAFGILEQQVGVAQWRVGPKARQRFVTEYSTARVERDNRLKERTEVFTDQQIVEQRNANQRCVVAAR